MSTYKKYVMPNDIRIYRQTGYIQGAHLHDFIEFVYIKNGKYVHTVDGVEYPVTKGNLVIINYSQTHSFHGDDKSEHYNILIKPGFIDEQIKNCDDFFALLDVSGYEDFKNLIDRDKCVIKFSTEEGKKFESTLFLLETELNNKDSGYQIMTRSCVNMILAMIFRKMSQPSFTSGEIVNEVMLQYIKEYCGEKLTIKSLCSNTHYNVSYFSRSFKKFTGITFTEYLKQARIERAAELLLNTDDKIDDICTKVGYSDKTKFFKHFRESTNTTPLKYRKSQNKILF